MVRELMKAEQARGALVGTPGSMHARHTDKPPKQYGPGFYGSKTWTLGFWVATILALAAFAGFIWYEETRHAEHVEEQQHGPETEEETLDTSGTAMADPTSTQPAAA